MSSASSEPLALLKRASRSGTVSFFLSSPETSMTIFPSYIMMSRLPWAMASFMLWVTIMVVRWFSSTIRSLRAKTAAKVLELSDRIVAENHLTTMMVTHNMKDAIAHGNRLIMMYNGRIVIDVSGEEKKKLTVPQLLELFSKVSGSDEADDKLLLS